eukprot:TRINITY_DN3336_c0_g1_i1.p1 TRINITY_DN3336_c0_g1~~TRINITY_DN3336_c0_g1_i1.p1  ORF type:complete len:113 (+),score=35.72 TRINITY_DN3336_c0_g1_i1:45-341(+)
MEKYDAELLNKLPRLKYDYRFPNQNQTKACWINFVDFRRCSAKYGETEEKCQVFRHNYRQLCPQAWVEKWKEQDQAGVFAVPPALDIEKKGGHGHGHH